MPFEALGPGVERHGLNGSMAGWTEARRRVLLTAVATAGPAAMAAALWADHLFTQSDVGNYLALARGDRAHAMMPFASRQLAPLLVRGLHVLTGVPVESGFVLLGGLSLGFLLTIVMGLLVRTAAPRWMVAASAGLLFWASQFNGLALPDLFYAALLAVLLLLLRAQRFYLAALWLLPMAVARESTLLTLVCLLVAGWRRLRAGEAATGVVATFAGLAIVKRLAAGAGENREHISPVMYMAAKMPWNFLKNVLGMNPWANLYQPCAVPRWQTAVHLGPLHAVGVCEFNAGPPIQLAAYLLASFGLLPVVLLLVWRSARRRPEPILGGREDMLLRFALVYGGLSFVMAPVLGQSLLRLFEYAWPLYLVALPGLLGRVGGGFRSDAAAWRFLTLHLVLSWLCLFLWDTPLLVAVLVVFLAGAWLTWTAWWEPVQVA